MRQARNRGNHLMNGIGRDSVVPVLGTTDDKVHRTGSGAEVILLDRSAIAAADVMGLVRDGRGETHGEPVLRGLHQKPSVGILGASVALIQGDFRVSAEDGL